MAIKFNVENVVYILGAGFSAQFGLPIMSNFLDKSNVVTYITHRGFSRLVVPQDSNRVFTSVKPE